MRPRSDGDGLLADQKSIALAKEGCHEPTIRRCSFIVLFARRHASLGADVTQSQAIASSDVLSQISMFSYEEDRKSDLHFRGTPVATDNLTWDFSLNLSTDHNKVVSLGKLRTKCSKASRSCSCAIT